MILVDFRICEKKLKMNYDFTVLVDYYGKQCVILEREGCRSILFFKILINI